MHESPRISIDEAINKAFWMVKIPSLTLLLGPLLLYVTLAGLNYVPSMGNDGFMWFAPTFLGSLSGSWLAWSIQIPRWRLWAYPQVDDIDELEHIAMESGYIWTQGGLFEKTEIMTGKMRKTLKDLRQRKKERA